MKRITKVLLASVFALLIHSHVFSKSTANNGEPRGIKITKTSFCTFSVTFSSVNEVKCNGGNTGSATANPSGGTPPYTYSWAPSGGNAATASGLTTGTYTVTVTDFVGCTSTASTAITQPTLLTNVVPNDTVCTGSCTGVLTMTASGGTPGLPPYFYSWTGGSTNVTITGLCAGSYTATAMDANGCIASAVATVVVHSSIPSLSIVPTITNATCSGTYDGSISLAVSAPSAPFKYAWQNSYETVYTGDSFNNLNPGIYTVTITDKYYNCNVLTYTVGSNYTCGYLDGTTFNDTDFTCTYSAIKPRLNTSYITINPGSYVVYPNSSGNYSQQMLPYGSYTVTQTLFAGSPFSACTPSQPVTVNASTPAINFADTTHTALSDPMITYLYETSFVVGDTATASFQIKNNGSAFSNGRAFFTIPDSMSLVTTTPPYSLLSNDTLYWNYAGLLPSNTINYTVHCKVDSNPSLLNYYVCANAGVIPSNPESNLGNNVAGWCAAMAEAYDPNEKSVSPAGVGPNGYINLTDSVLTYTIRFQNTGDAKATNIYIVDTISSHLDMSTLNVLGASNAFSYTYSGNRVRFTFSNINLPDSIGNQAGSRGWIEYRIHQSKANDTGDVIHNTAYIYFDFNSPVVTNTTTNTIGCPLSAPSIVVSNVACNGGNTGSATASPSEGTAPFTYSWSGGGGTNATANNLTAGTYTVNMKDVNGCFASAIANITQPSALNASTNIGGNVSCNGGNDGSITSSVSGGTIPYTFLWSNSQNTPNVNSLTVGTYTLSVTDVNGCTSTATTTITQPNALSITADSINDNSGCNGSAWAKVNGGTTPYSYSWTGGSTTDTINNQCAGNYCCVVTDAKGCADSVCVSISIILGSENAISNNENIKLHPNPNNGKFTIQVANSRQLTANSSVLVYNMLGEKVYDEALSQAQGNNTIDLGSKSSGVYLYRVVTENGSLVGEGKFIIQK